MEEQLSKAQEIITQSNLQEEIKSRILAFLPSMRNLRPKDQLYFFQKKGLIKEQLIKAWEDLRHPAAHASQVNPKKLQGYIDRYHAVTVLFHQLIFLAIGYTGCYTDYDSPGFPFEYFPFGAGKEEEQQQGVLETK